MEKDETREGDERKREREREGEAGEMKPLSAGVAVAVLPAWSHSNASEHDGVPRWTCVSPISSNVTRRSAPSVCVLARFAKTHRMHLSLAMHPFVPCITGLCFREKRRRQRDLCSGPLNTYLLAYQRVSDHGQTIFAHPFSCTLALRFSPQSFFLLSANGARWKIKTATNSPISRVLRYLHLSATTITHNCDRCVIMRSYLSGNKRSEMI